MDELVVELHAIRMAIESQTLAELLCYVGLIVILVIMKVGGGKDA